MISKIKYKFLALSAIPNPEEVRLMRRTTIISSKYAGQIFGFTLIELLVVIAILGILAAVVLVAINPAERINEANDSNKKSIVGQTATAAEACYTQNSGSYANCDTVAELAGTSGYLKQAPSPSPDMLNTSTTAVRVSLQLSAASAACASGSGAYKAFVYRSSSGITRVECAANYAALTAP